MAADYFLYETPFVPEASMQLVVTLNMFVDVLFSPPRSANVILKSLVLIWNESTIQMLQSHCIIHENLISTVIAVAFPVLFIGVNCLLIKGGWGGGGYISKQNEAF